MRTRVRKCSRSMLLHRLVSTIALSLALSGSTVAQAAIEIQIESQGVRRIPLLVEAFAGEAEGANQLSKVVQQDLDRTGLFHATHVEVSRTLPFQSPDYDELLAANHEYLLVGELKPGSSGTNDRIVFQLIDLITRNAEEAFSLDIGPKQERLVAHVISNWIYERLTGEPGVFTSKIAYVLRTGPKDTGTYELKISDYDGHNHQTLIRSNEPIISPDWDPSGDFLLYVSYERRKPIIYEHALLTGIRRTVASFKGNNSAPSMSPDRRWVAVALSESGTTQIYLLSADGTRKLRLRESTGIDTEPAFSPNNEEVAFVSDEFGTPQLYLRNRVSGNESRLTFGSSYNVSPRFSADGNLLTYVRRDQNGINVHMLDPHNPEGGTVPLTGIDLADSPTFSPDGRMLLFKNDARDNILYTVSINGKIARPFTMPETGEIKDPTWGPATSSWY